MPYNPDQEKHRFYDLRRRAEALGAYRDPDIATYLAHLEQNPSHTGLAAQIGFWLDEYEEEQRLSPNFLAPPPSAEDLEHPVHPADFMLGQTTETGVPFGVRIGVDCGSIVVAGISGGGKTTLIQNIVARVHQFLPRVAILVFDVKGDFTCIASIPGPSIHVHRVQEELRLGLLKPPAGVPLESWLATVATYFCEYRGLKKSRHLFLDVAHRLCRHFGVDQDPAKPWPSLKNILEYLNQMRGARFGKDAEYKASLTNELHGLLDDTGSVFDTCDGTSLDEHLLCPGGIAVAQLDTTPVPAQQLIISLGIERIIQAQKAKNVHNTELQVLVILDEAQLVLSQSADHASANGVAPLAGQLLRAREMALGFVVAPHLLPDISRSVLAAAKTVFVVGGLSDSLSIDLADRMLNLPAKAKTMIPRLGRGQAITREIGKGIAYTDAFLVDLDVPELVKDAIDEPARRKMMAQKRSLLPATPSKPLTDYPSIVAELNPGRAGSQSPASATTTGHPQTQEQQDMLLECARHRDDWMKERQARVNISDYKVFLKLAQSLEAQGLLAVHEIRLGSTTYTFIEVTDAGWQAIQRPKPQGYIGHGSFVHTVLIGRISRHLTAQGWSNVQPEFRIGQNLHAVDIYGRSPTGIPTALEVTLSMSNVVSNALNSVAVPGGVPELIFLCQVDADVKKATKLLAQNKGLSAYLPQIRIRRIDQFIS